jgi:hypothetical protein
MKNVICILTILLMCSSSSFCKEKDYKAKAAAAGSTEATSLSMAVWGVGLAAAITTVFLLVKSSDGTSSHSH